MSPLFIEGDLPDLRDILAPPSNNRTITNDPKNPRRSPRKHAADTNAHPAQLNCSQSDLYATPSQVRRSPAKKSPTKIRQDVAERSKNIRTSLHAVPILPRIVPMLENKSRNNVASSPQHGPRSIKLAHVDSLLLPLSQLVVQEDKGRKQDSQNDDIGRRETGVQRPQRLTTTQRPADRFFLKEARCSEDESVDADEEDEETDLSGFIVDDNAELTVHDTSDSDDDRKRRKARPKATTKRRLYRGRRHHLATDDEAEGAKPREAEVVDLTSSPVKDKPSDNVLHMDDPFAQTASRNEVTSLFHDFDRVLRLSLPKLESPSKSILKAGTPDLSSNADASDREVEHRPTTNLTDEKRFTTPPVTPPASPSKLKSPSKLLSPSKRDAAHHRQSTDAFWDLNAINEWHDQYSPKKAPSPRKALARFNIWSDDSGDEDQMDSSDSLPSPCSSPTKTTSPCKSPVKAELRRLADERKARVSRKKAFEESRVQLANDLFNELDKHVASSKISQMSSSTGGVQILWSKTLRSTAGRANWKRTITKPSGSLVKGLNPDPRAPDVKVSHFANIELAEKVIDCEERLVNTLSHEFCHLANFMVSGIRDQPHGASFKKWATKVTEHLGQSQDPVWQKCQVTTKHGYKIDWKYLWVCTGRDQTKAMEMMSIEEEGCGTEYGRHSKSIDTDKQRCGRCKGKLVQVRPKPRKSPVKVQRVLGGKVVKQRSSSGSETERKQAVMMRKEMEVIELSD